MFIGREQELKFLESTYKRKDGQLVVLYGRRRIGKTETLREFCKGKKHVFYSCVEIPDKLQLRAFSERLLQEKMPVSDLIKEFSDWTAAFRSLLSLPYGDEKKLVIIDEFPYMCKGNSSIPSILQNLWDEFFKSENIMLILCGSSMSFIENDLLAEKNPLYGRATGIYKMETMNFYDAMKFFPDYSARDKIMTYSVLGGIPHYLNQFDPNMPLADNIKENILTKGRILYNEVEFLLHQELRETTVYNSIIQAVALGNTKMNDICSKSLVSESAKASVYLKCLIELGLMEREFSVDDGIKTKANTNRGLYRLTDNFFRFWYAFIFPNISELDSSDADGFYKYIIEPDLHEYASLAFEDVCRQYIRNMQRCRRLPFRYEHMGRWWGKTYVRRNDRKETQETEIDLLAVSRKEQKYLIGECKFKGSPFSYAEYLDTAAKLSEHEDFKRYYYLFSESGFDYKLTDEAENNEYINLIPIDEIVNSPIK